MTTDFKKALYAKIGTDSYESWFAPKPSVFEGMKEKYKAREGARFSTNSFGVLVIEVHSRFFKDQIISRFGSAIHEVATSLGFKIAHVIMAAEAIPRAELPIDAEQGSQIKYVLSKIRRFAHSQWNHKASSALFTHGREDDIVEELQPKPNPAYVYRGNQGLRFSAGGNGCALHKEETQPSDESLGQEGVIFPVIIRQPTGEMEI